MARLIVLAGSNIGESYELSQTNSLGSGNANAVIIPDPDVSEYHAQLSQIKKRFYIVNLTVSDTIEVNGREVEKIMLSNGDSLKLGATTFLFSDEHEEANDEEDLLGEESEMKELDFGKYKIVEEISRGANAVVYKAVQKGLDRVVALKVMLSGEHAGREEINRFYSEARAVATLTHANIVPIFDIGVYNKRHYFAMEYIEGKTLGAALEEHDISPMRGLKAIEQVALALAYAHQQSIVHRDIKPTNILIDSFGKALLSDFGIAKQLGGGSKTNTQTGQALGTPAYMAPEQAEGKIRISPRADIYSLGAVLYEIFTGRKPYDASSAAAILMKVLTEDPTPPQKINPTIHPDVATIISKAMERDPDRRYQTVKAMADDIASYRRGQQIKAKPASRLYYTIQLLKRNVVAVTAISIALLSTMASLFYMSVTSKNAKRQISAIEIEKEKVVSAAEKVAQQTAREQRSRWQVADNSSSNHFANWNRKTNRKRTIAPQGGRLLSRADEIINLSSKAEYTGNLQVSFNFEPSADSPPAKISGYINRSSLNNLQFKLIRTNTDNYQISILHTGTVLALRDGVVLPPGSPITISFKLQGIQAWLSVQHGSNAPTGLSYRGLELIKVPYRRKVEIAIEKSPGSLRDLKLSYEDLPIKPTRLDLAHVYFLKNELDDAHVDYRQISQSPTYSGDSMAVEALYYAGLTLVANGNFADAHTIFDNIINGKNLNAVATTDQIRRARLQNIIALSEMDKLQAATAELKNMMENEETPQLSTPWEWRFLTLLPRYYNSGHYQKTLEILRAFKWSPANTILDTQIERLAALIRRRNPELLAELISSYPTEVILPHLNQTLRHFQSKKKWEELVKLRRAIISTELSNAAIDELLRQQLYAALAQNGDRWHALLGYFNNRKPHPAAMDSKILESFDTLLAKDDITNCLEIYRLWPLPDFFARLVSYENEIPSSRSSHFSQLTGHDADLAIDILMEALKFNDARSLLERELTYRPKDKKLLLRRALLMEIDKERASSEAWQELAALGEGFECDVARLFNGEIEAEALRLKHSATQREHIIDFYLGFVELIAKNKNMARILLQRSSITNSNEEWPYQLCRRLTRSLNNRNH